MAKCKATRKDGKPCQAAAQTPAGFCIHHDPDLAGKRDTWKRAGGKVGTIATLAAPKAWRNLEGNGDGAGAVIMAKPTPDDLVVLLADTIDEVKTGEIDPKVANAVGYLAGAIVKILQYEALEERLAAIEEAIGIGS